MCCLPRQPCLLQGRIGFSPGHRRGVGAKFRNNRDFNRGIRGADLEILKVAHLLQGLFGGRKVAIVRISLNMMVSRPMSFGHLAQCFAKFAFVQGLVQLFLVFGIVM